MQTKGLYKGKPLSWGLGKASTGNPQFVMRVRVNEMARDAEDSSAGFEELQDDKGVAAPLVRQIFMTITVNTKDRIVAELKSIGYTGELKSSKLNPGNPDSFDFGAKEVLLRCAHDEYQGRVREKWELARQMRGQLSREDQDQFDQMFGEVSELPENPIPPTPEAKPVPPSGSKRKKS